MLANVEGVEDDDIIEEEMDETPAESICSGAETDLPLATDLVQTIDDDLANLEKVVFVDISLHTCVYRVGQMHYRVAHQQTWASLISYCCSRHPRPEERDVKSSDRIAIRPS